jgi:hypothetical protein
MNLLYNFYALKNKLMKQRNKITTTEIRSAAAGISRINPSAAGVSFPAPSVAVNHSSSATAQLYSPKHTEVENYFMIFNGKIWQKGQLIRVFHNRWLFKFGDGSQLTVYNKDQHNIKTIDDFSSDSYDESDNESSDDEMIDISNLKRKKSQSDDDDEVLKKRSVWESDDEIIDMGNITDHSDSETNKSNHSDDENDLSDNDEEMNDTYSSLKDKYKSWTPKEKFQEVNTPFGISSVRHNRKAPYITTNTKQYPKTKVKVDYKDIIKNLRETKLSEKEIAQILLEGEADSFSSNSAKRAAAMLSAIVYLAEQWRKQGAVKIYRAVLRAIVEGKFTFNDFLKYFEFIVSAKAGREQVARLQQFLKGKLGYEELSDKDKIILGNMSPLREDDLDSDDDLRDIKEKDFKKGREKTKYWEKSKKEKLKSEDIVFINGTIYNLNHPEIRGGGLCLWDTLEYLGIDSSDLIEAAGNQYHTFFFADAIEDLLNTLSAEGVTIRINLQVFTYDGVIDNQNSRLYGTSGPVYHIGLVYDPQTGLGHYIPALNKK